MENVPESKHHGDGGDGGNPEGERRHRLRSRRISVEYLASVDEGLGGSSAVKYVSGFEDEGFVNTSDFHGCSEAAIDALLSNSKFILLNAGKKRKLRAALLDLRAGRTVEGDNEVVLETGVISIPVETLAEFQPALDPELHVDFVAETRSAEETVTIDLDLAPSMAVGGGAVTDPHHAEGDQCSEDGEIQQADIIQTKPAEMVEV